MPGSARAAPKEFIYHVLTGGNNRQDAFCDDEEFGKYLGLLCRDKNQYKYKLHHDVLMSKPIRPVMETTREGFELNPVRKEYRSFVQKMQHKHDSIRGAMDRRTIYGGSDFVQKVQKRCKPVAGNCVMKVQLLKDRPLGRKGEIKCILEY